MTIRVKLTVAFMVAVLVAIGCVIMLVSWQMRKDALATYLQTAQGQLVRINECIESSFRKDEEIARFAAGSPAVLAAGDTLPDYASTTLPTRVPRENMTPEVAQLDKEFQRFVDAHPGFATIGVGMENGRYLEYPVSTRPAGFDPRQKDWYRSGKSATNDVALTEAYRTVKGLLACSITSKVYDGTTLRGLVAIDISLDTLVNLISQIKIGATGYVMLVEASGSILADPKHKDLLSKNLSEGVLPGLENVLSHKATYFTAVVDGIPRVVSVADGYNKWKLVAIADEAEIYAAVNAVIKDIILVGLGIAFLMLLVSLWLSRSITRPIDMLVLAAGNIAQGDHTALPEGKLFAGEMGRLRNSLEVMVRNLGQHIATAIQKTQEAEEQTENARLALKEAEEARSAAEKAKRDGMLTAAGQLEDVVAIVSSASEELSTQIEQSERGSSEQAARVAETATAVDEMNSTVLEVARNASSAADISTQTRSKAEYGAKVVENVVSAIGAVQKDSLVLKNGMATLGEHAQAINQIMGVISDIADQTNLLALNAAIEAARAGEAGRGFAVVADEVRKLAEKTMASTTDVGNAIRSIQQSAQDSAKQVEVTVQNIETATALAGQCGEALHEIVAMADSTADQVRAIATASEEQSATSEEIAKSVNLVNSIAAETARAMEEAARAVSELANQSQVLGRLIEDMKRED